MSESPPLGHATALSVAAIRLATVLAIFLAEGAETPVELGEAAFDALILVAALWAAGMGALALAGRRDGVGTPESIVDLALLGGLTYASGGAFSEVRQAFLVVPIVAAATHGPPLTATWSLIAAGVFSLAALSVDVGELPGAGTTILTHDIFLGVVAIASVLTSILLRRQSAETLAHAERGRSLARRLLEVRDEERRELSRGLHDHPVQLLGAARVELGAAREGSPDALDRISERVELAEAALRETALDLHPYALEELGLCEAIKRVADAECGRAGMELSFDCDPLSPSPLDRQLFAIARELISNAARHSRGTMVEVRVCGSVGSISLEVSDDGVGLDAERRRRALREGHLGLISVAERSESIGAELSVQSSPDEGTRVRLVVST